MRRGRVQPMVLLDLALLHGFQLYLKLTSSKNIDKPAFQKFSGGNRLLLLANFTRLTISSLHNMPFFLKCKYLISSLLSSLLSVLSCMQPAKPMLCKMSLLTKGSSESVGISISRSILNEITSSI